MTIHPFCYPVDIKKIKNIIQNKNIKIIEDVAESIGAKIGKGYVVPWRYLVLVFSQTKL